MSKSSKYILASGCSFTDSTYKSNQLPSYDTSYPKWPELFKNMVNPDLSVVNTADSGGSNDYIAQSIIKKVIHDHQNIEAIVVGWTAIDRYENFLGAAVKGNAESRVNLSYAYRTGPDDIILKYGWDATEQAKYYLHNVKIWKKMIASWIGNIYNVQQIAKAFNIPIVQAQMIRPAGGHPFTAEEYIELFLRLLQKVPHFFDIDEHTFMGFPVDTNLDGYYLDLYIDPDERVARSIGDHHPNKKGHEKLAKIYYDRYKLCHMS